MFKHVLFLILAPMTIAAILMIGGGIVSLRESPAAIFGMIFFLYVCHMALVFLKAYSHEDVERVIAPERREAVLKASADRQDKC